MIQNVSIGKLYESQVYVNTSIHNNSNSVIEFPFKASIYIVYTALKEVEVVV